jgi:hypothetical protein
MANAGRRDRQRRRAKSLIGSLQEFLTPSVFKQVRNASNEGSTLGGTCIRCSTSFC